MVEREDEEGEARRGRMMEQEEEEGEARWGRMVEREDEDVEVWIILRWEEGKKNGSSWLLRS